MKTILALILGTILSSVLSAQDTWSGLRFGMTLAEVRTAYQGTGTLKESEEGELNTTQDLFGAPASVFLAFVSKHLSHIVLRVDKPFANKTASDASVSSVVMIDSLNKVLTEKYGKPLTDEADCDLTPRKLIYEKNPSQIWTCKRMWRSNGQNINLMWVYERGYMMFLTLDYKPFSKEL